jgi:hypothetical protein
MKHIIALLIWAAVSYLAWIASTKYMESQNKKHDDWHHITNGQWLALRVLSCLPLTNFCILLGCGEELIDANSGIIKWFTKKKDFK